MVLEKNMLINNRYRIQEQIGVGGMAIVYRAIDEKLDREVTFKVLKEDYINDEEFIKRFSTEARAAARLSNSNIVNVYDVGNDGNIHYIVMEYIDGFTLKELISSKAPFTDEEAVGIGLQIGAALEHAHKNGIVHRDIKPENILITKSGNQLPKKQFTPPLYLNKCFIQSPASSIQLSHSAWIPYPFGHAVSAVASPRP